MKKIGLLTAVVLLAGFPASSIYAQTFENGEIPEDWETLEEPETVPETQIPSGEFEQPATQDTQETAVPGSEFDQPVTQGTQETVVPGSQAPRGGYAVPASEGTQETVVPDAATSPTEQETVIPAEPGEHVLPSDPAAEPRQPSEEFPEDQQETQIPNEDPDAQGELPPADQGAPVLVIPVTPEEGSEEEGSGETQLLIIPLEPEEGQPTPGDEPQFPPEEEPAPESDTQNPDQEQVFIQ